jgi:hydrophobe/amphiphile efflux-3 (HAE3) family protein
MGERFGGIVRLAARRPLVVLVAIGALALAGAGLALRLDPSTATDTLVNRSSDTFKATERFNDTFGDEAVIVLVRGNLQRTVLTSDLGRLLRLEGCLSGNVPARGLRELPPACGKIRELKPAKVVYGPGTFINTAAGQISDEYIRRQEATRRQAAAAARAARKLSAKRGDPPAQQRRLARAAQNAVQAQFTQQVLQLGLRYGLTGLPRIDSPDFVSSLVFDNSSRCPGGGAAPKAKFAYLFPSCNAALIQIRMRPDLTDQERRRAVELFKQAAREPSLEPREGARYIVTGVPVVAEGLATAVQHAIFVLLGAALLVMAATLALVFRTRLRLLPLGLALAAAAMTFGALSLAGGSLTMASIAVLPVLIGLAVDYAIQFQARFDETRQRRPRPATSEAAVSAASAGGPTIATAGLATAVGFLVLLLSPVPMVRGFGLLLVLGIVLALGCALTAGFAALVRFGEPRRRPADLPPAFPRLRERIDNWGLALRESRAAEWVADRSWRALHASLERPRRVLAIGLAVAIVGWAVDTQSKVDSDVRELIPGDLQALRDVNQLQEETGVSGEIDVTVRADDITKPGVIAWMTRFQGAVLKAHGYKSGKRCTDTKGAPELCPALSLPDIFSSGGAARPGNVRQLLDSVPPYFSQGVVSPDRKTANMAFGIRLMPLDRQNEVVDDIKRRLDPPKGVEASVVGLPVLAAEANEALSSPWRRDLTLLAALLGVFLVLLAVRRSRREAAVPLVPIALATGWSGGLLFLLGLLPGPLEVDLNPMSVTLGALVIAISTEFSVLLSSRYRQEREAGAGPARAIQLTYASTGAAVLASGATAIAGFAALVASDIRMLRDFGILTVADLTISLLGVMVVLPAALLWAEEHGPFGLSDLDPRPPARELWEARPSLSLPRPRLPRRRPRLRALRRRSGA